MDNSRSPFNYQGFQSIFLIEIGIHKLFHGFYREPALATFLIILYFLVLHVRYNIFELFKRKYLVSSGLNTLLRTWIKDR